MKILAEQNDLVFGDDVIGYCGLFLIYLFVASYEEFTRAIYPPMNFTGRYVVGGVAFSDRFPNNIIGYEVYSNSTYDKCYEKRSTDMEKFNIHEAEIQTAVANAISKFYIKGILANQK